MDDQHLGDIMSILYLLTDLHTWYLLDASIGLSRRQHHESTRMAILNLNCRCIVTNIRPGIAGTEQSWDH